MEVEIIHNKCGLPVELCECPDAAVIYDWETDMFVPVGGDEYGEA